MGSSEADLAMIEQIRPIVGGIGTLFSGIAVALGLVGTLATLS